MLIQYSSSVRPRLWSSEQPDIATSTVSDNRRTIGDIRAGFVGAGMQCRGSRGGASPSCAFEHTIPNQSAYREALRAVRSRLNGCPPLLTPVPSDPVSRLFRPIRELRPACHYARASSSRAIGSWLNRGRAGRSSLVSGGFPILYRGSVRPPEGSWAGAARRATGRTATAATAAYVAPGDC